MSFDDQAGSRVRVAVIDSGVHAQHPHVAGVAGGVGITPEGREHEDFIDRIGHGTAVAAVIREKAPGAELYAVKIFDQSLTAPVESLCAAIRWAIRNGMDVVNLSLGTAKQEHEAALRLAIGEALERRLLVVAAYDDGETRWLPGSLDGVLPVMLDWNCPRHEYRLRRLPDGKPLYAASGYPRPIPGVSPERNLKGTSFAVANMCGFVARSPQEFQP